MFKQFKIFIFICFAFSFVYATETDKINHNAIYIKNIYFEGVTDKDELKDLQKISKDYLNKKLNIKNLQQLKKDLSNYFKKRGLLFTKVLLPAQNLTKGTLKFSIIKTKIKNIQIIGNKYYSTDFIKRIFGFKEGDNLQYRKMLKNILLLNKYSDLTVKSYLKKGTDFGTTNVVLKVEDEKPFHATVSLDNSGSQETAKNRVNIDVRYGNSLYDGDNITFKSTLGVSSLSASTRLFILNYNTSPLGDYYSRINLGYMYADYITTGDLAALDLEGDTKIFNLGIQQPLYYSTVLESDLSLMYYKKAIKSYILGDISTTDWLNLAELKLYLKYTRITDIFTYGLSISKGINKDSTKKSRLDSDDRFIKYNLSTSYIKYINPENSFQISFNSQYTKDRLPLSELFTSGIKGTDGTKILGDSGFNTKIEWLYHPKVDYLDWLKNSIQVRLYLNYVKAFSNNIVPGEVKSSYLTSAGSNITLNIKKRYFGSISLSLPVDSSDKTIQRKIQIYGYIGMKLW